MDPSPEVLKRIKNVALHEKYIDQLHCREAKRRTHAKGKFISPLSNKDEAGVILKAARNALISEASNAIGQFKHMQANPTDDYAEFESGTDDDVDD